MEGVLPGALAAGEVVGLPEEVRARLVAADGGLIAPAPGQETSVSVADPPLLEPAERAGQLLVRIVAVVGVDHLAGGDFGDLEEAGESQDWR